MNRELAARKSFYTAILNTINVPGGSGNVPVSDSKAETGLSLYILIEDQTGRQDSDFRNHRWTCTLSLAIVHKQESSYTRDIVDDVCEQIENIILPGKANVNGLPAQSGWQFTNVYLDDISYSDFQISETETICIKYITFNFITTKI